MDVENSTIVSIDSSINIKLDYEFSYFIPLLNHFKIFIPIYGLTDDKMSKNILKSQDKITKQKKIRAPRATPYFYLFKHYILAYT